MTIIGSYWRKSKGVFAMPVSFAPLWRTMKAQGVSTYALKHKVRIGGGTYNRLKANQDVSTHTIGILCRYLKCPVQDVMEYIDEEAE